MFGWMTIALAERRSKLVKAGDYVHYSDGTTEFDWYHAGSFEVVEVKDNSDVILSNGESVSDSWLVMDCDLVHGQEVEVCGDGKYKEPQKAIFNQYRPELIKPYECVFLTWEAEFQKEKGFEVFHCKYARAGKPRFKAYRKPKIEWIGEPINLYTSPFAPPLKVEGIFLRGPVWFVKLSNGFECNMEDLLGKYFWVKGCKHCGNEVKNGI